jgi:branched-chain amino acid transport system substrate-binding protein
MKHKELVILLVNTCLVLVLATPTLAQTTGKPLKVGFMYELTGTFSTMGSDTQKTAEIAVEMMNKTGGIKGHPIEYVTYDSQSNATQATLSAKKLIETEKIHILLGSNTNGTGLAVGPVCETNGVPFITASVADVFEKTLKPQWSFRVTWKGWEMIDLGLGMAKKLNPNNKNIVVLYMGAPFGKDMYKNAVHFAPMRGLQILAAEQYDTTKTDFGPQIIKLISANPDVVMVYCSDMAGPLAMKQMREMGMNKPIISNGALNVKAVREAFKDTFSIPPYVYSSGSTPDVWWQLPKDSQEYKLISPVASMFEKKYGEKYGGIHQLSYNALLVVKDSLERALKEDPNLLSGDLKTIRTALRDKIETTKNFNTGAGIFTMSPKDHCGVHIGSPFAPFHWKNGEIVYDSELRNITPSPPPPD